MTKPWPGNRDGPEALFEGYKINLHFHVCGAAQLSYYAHLDLSYSIISLNELNSFRINFKKCGCPHICIKIIIQHSAVTGYTTAFLLKPLAGNVASMIISKCLNY